MERGGQFWVGENVRVPTVFEPDRTQRIFASRDKVKFSNVLLSVEDNPEWTYK